MARGVTATAIADSVLRLAVLLQAGVAPSRAWEYLAEAGDEHAARVCAASATGMPLPAAIARSDTAPARRRPLSRQPADAGSAATRWRDVSAAWQVATAVGAPLAESLRALSIALRDAQEAADDVRVALAEPAATARLMAWLPLVAVLLGRRARLRHVRHADRQPDRHRLPPARRSADLRCAEVERRPGEAVARGRRNPGSRCGAARDRPEWRCLDRPRTSSGARCHGLDDGCRDRCGARSLAQRGSARRRAAARIVDTRAAPCAGRWTAASRAAFDASAAPAGDLHTPGVPPARGRADAPERHDLRAPASLIMSRTRAHQPCPPTVEGTPCH